MQVNGWVRLWIVFSVCWLVIAAYLGYSAIHELLEPVSVKLAKEGVGSATFVFSRADSQEVADEYLRTVMTPLVDANPVKYVGKVSTDQYDTKVEKELKPMVQRHFAIAVIPVVLALLAGVAFSWVRRGFAPTRS